MNTVSFNFVIPSTLLAIAWLHPKYKRIFISWFMRPHLQVALRWIQLYVSICLYQFIFTKYLLFMYYRALLLTLFSVQVISPPKKFIPWLSICSALWNTIVINYNCLSLAWMPPKTQLSYPPNSSLPQPHLPAHPWFKANLVSQKQDSSSLPLQTLSLLFPINKNAHFFLIYYLQIPLVLFLFNLRFSFSFGHFSSCFSVKCCNWGYPWPQNLLADVFYTFIF